MVILWGPAGPASPRSRQAGFRPSPLHNLFQIQSAPDLHFPSSWHTMAKHHPHFWSRLPSVASSFSLPPATEQRLGESCFAPSLATLLAIPIPKCQLPIPRVVLNLPMITSNFGLSCVFLLCAVITYMPTTPSYEALVVDPRVTHFRQVLHQLNDVLCLQFGIVYRDAIETEQKAGSGVFTNPGLVQRLLCQQVET